MFTGIEVIDHIKNPEKLTTERLRKIRACSGKIVNGKPVFTNIVFAKPAEMTPDSVLDPRD